MKQQDAKENLAEAPKRGFDAVEQASGHLHQARFQRQANVDEGRSSAGKIDAGIKPLSPAACSSTLDPTVGVKVVLCICTCKRPVGLARLLEAVAELDFEGRLSVVVVDNDAAGAAEGIAVCRRMVAAGYRWPLVCVGEERRGIAFARNRVVALALEQEPDFIAILDDDERPCREWLRELVRVQVETGADAVSGPVIPEFAPDTPRWLIEGRFFENESFPDKAEVRLRSIGNLLAKTCCFRALMPEPFDTRFALTGGEGGVFFRQLAGRNYTMRWAMNARSFESVPPSRANLRWLMQRRFRKGVNTIRSQRLAQPQASGELRRLAATMRLLVAGVIHFVVSCRERIRRTRAMLRVCQALGRAAGHLGLRYSEYRRIHGA